MLLHKMNPGYFRILEIGQKALSSFNFYCGVLTSVPVRHGHWFTKYYRTKKIIRPISNEVMEKYKEASTIKLPEGKSVPSLFRQYLDESTPEPVRKIHSYEFSRLHTAVDDVMKDKLRELGLNPAEDSTAHEIVRLTVRIRVLREQMEKKNSLGIERALLRMIDRREGMLRLLRSEDYAQFLSLAKGMQLTFQHEPRPELKEPPRPGFQQRLAETRARCQRLKMRRLAELAEKSEAAKTDFLRRREAALADAREKLAGLGLTLEQVLDEVYSDRRTAANADLLDDKLSWYYGEQRQHLKHLAEMEAKAKAAQAKGRK